MFEIGQNWGKIANYPPNAQHKSARLAVTRYTLYHNAPIRMKICITSSRVLFHAWKISDC